MNIIFDMDDTLYDLMQPFKKAHQDLYSNKIITDCNKLFMNSRIYSDKILESEKKELISHKDCFYLRIKKTYYDIGIQISRKDAELFETKYRHYQSHITIPENIVKVLNFCKTKHIFIALLSNGMHSSQYRKIQTLKLEQWFTNDKIFISEDTGYLKPDVNIFKFVEEKLHLLPDETWYVGDTYETDIKGADNAGCNTIWFNHRNRMPPQPDNLADREVNSCTELLVVINELYKNFDKV
ncbi:HAD family hydrolase [Pectinatus frisingensis]|uniref:HAD family hydrolase n=1 Tax=Pectinatus frisingensis TaxID=865 RepID=UPI0018C47598|nr:HAD family hydrolase [Pectinatus frisingensis]